LHYLRGLKGENAGNTRLMFILHRPDSRALQTSVFGGDYETALKNSKTGQTLTEILEYCSLTWDDIFVTNVFKCLLPEDRNPTREEYERCISVLKKQIDDFGPRCMIAFGTKVYGLMFSHRAKYTGFEETAGETLEYKVTPTLVFHHPSKLGTIMSHEKEKHYGEIKEFLETPWIRPTRNENN
jgi:uracil-DNA glycosylase family 4